MWTCIPTSDKAIPGPRVCAYYCNGRCRGGMCGPRREGEPSWKPGKSGDPVRQEGEKAGSWHQTVEEDRHHGMPQDMGDGLVTTPSHIYTQSTYHFACMLINAATTITGIIFYCIICFWKINHFVVKNHLYSSSGEREVVSSTITK